MTHRKKHYKNTDSSFHILSIIVSSSPKTFYSGEEHSYQY